MREKLDTPDDFFFPNTMVKVALFLCTIWNALPREKLFLPLIKHTVKPMKTFPGENYMLDSMYTTYPLYTPIDANEPKYHKLDRGNEKSKVKTRAPWSQQKGEPENYSVLTYD